MFTNLITAFLAVLNTGFKFLKVEVLCRSIAQVSADL